MQNKTNTNIERIIAKIDNDFNPDNSDWIPRVGAWCIQAMQMIDCLPTKKKKKTLSVKDRIAYSPCINNGNLKVYDKYGNKIKHIDEEKSSCGLDEDESPSTGEETWSHASVTTSTVCDDINPNAVHAPQMVAQTINTKEWPGRYNVVEAVYPNNVANNHNYVLITNDKIELNFDTDKITIEYEDIETCQSNIYGCEVPVIPNNGLLIEALGYYCLYKMLCRGFKHPVFNLAASQYGTNPYYIWTQLKDEAKRDIINNGFDKGDDPSHLFRSNFFIQTFDSRH